MQVASLRQAPALLAKKSRVEVAGTYKRIVLITAVKSFIVQVPGTIDIRDNRPLNYYQVLTLKSRPYFGNPSILASKIGECQVPPVACAVKI
jgi:hypothetical protein